MGDFNTILRTNDRVNGMTIQESKVREFRDILSRAELCELKTIGRDYTWSNGHIFSMIDSYLLIYLMTSMSPWRWTTNDEEVKDEILIFYKNLLGTSSLQLPAIKPEICAFNNVLTRSQRLQLIAPMTRADVWSVQ
ncbi:hypothetical protein HAX54_006918 [Datura stramonium]|uniref:Uncharacterized protein n=1 Tax=Datura stramonium TaxID=4076 RepID=A0ABS8WXI6_DATST|nr:hypothetical protein [Datura stramonium]